MEVTERFEASVQLRRSSVALETRLGLVMLGSVDDPERVGEVEPVDVVVLARVAVCMGVQRPAAMLSSRHVLTRLVRRYDLDARGRGGA